MIIWRGVWINKAQKDEPSPEAEKQKTPVRREAEEENQKLIRFTQTTISREYYSQTAWQT